MPEYNVFFRMEVEGSARELAKKLKEEKPYKGVNTAYRPKSEEGRIYTFWDHGMLDEPDEDSFDIAVLLNHLIGDGARRIYGLYASEEQDDESLGMFFFVDGETKIDPRLCSLYSGDYLEPKQEYFPSMFRRARIADYYTKKYPDDVPEDLFSIDGKNYHECLDCVAAAHERGEVTVVNPVMTAKRRKK